VHCRADNHFAVDDLIYVSTADLLLPKGQATKLLPKYIGPFKVLETHTNTSSYKVKLPAQLQVRNLHNQFHRSKLHPYLSNDNVIFSHREKFAYYDYSIPNDQEWLVEEILSHKWDKNSLQFKICWNLGDITWEPFEACKELQALTKYLQLRGIEDPFQLPH
jgi:hypothetical protein